MKGDRKDFDFVKTSLSAKGFDVVYDINGKPDSYNILSFFTNTAAPYFID